MKVAFLIFSYMSLTSSIFASEFDFAELQIEITQTAISKVGQRDGSLKVRPKDRIISEQNFKKMESLGGSSGFYLPNIQPLKDLFLVTKLGDYDGRLLAITKKGNILNLPKGNTYADASFLYSVRQSETEGDAYAVVDLKIMKVIKEGNEIPSDVKNKMKTLKPVFPGTFYQSWQPLSK